MLDNLINILEEKKPLHIVLSQSLDRQTEEQDKRFISRLTRACVERALTLDTVLNSYSSVKVKKMKPVIRNILRMGVCQILFMDFVTDFAACDESVKLAGKRNLKGLTGFVNGVLRTVCREKEKIAAGIENGVPSYKYSMPEWIVKLFNESFTAKESEEAFKYFLSENGIGFRCNTSVSDAKEVIKGLKSQAQDMGNVQENRYIDYCFSVSGSGSASGLKGFKEGQFVVQDFSSVLLGYTADACYKAKFGIKNNAETSAKVLDLCAAPGGKSMHMADMGYKVTSCDLTEAKCSLISEAAKRCGFKDVDVKVNDATVYNKSFDRAFDIVICDLPCSRLGIIGKKPDIKYNASPEKCTELAELQKEILKNAVRYLKPDGILLYSTCTLTKCENTDNYRFLTDELGMKGIPLKGKLPKGIEPQKADDGYIVIRPGQYGSDGFFISCLEMR